MKAGKQWWQKAAHCISLGEHFFTLSLKVGGRKQKNKAEHFPRARGDSEYSDFPGEKEESSTNSNVDLMCGFGPAINLF